MLATSYEKQDLEHYREMLYDVARTDIPDSP